MDNSILQEFLRNEKFKTISPKLIQIFDNVEQYVIKYGAKNSLAIKFKAIDNLLANESVSEIDKVYILNDINKYTIKDIRKYIKDFNNFKLILENIYTDSYTSYRTTDDYIFLNYMIFNNLTRQEFNQLLLELDKELLTRFYHFISNFINSRDINEVFTDDTTIYNFIEYLFMDNKDKLNEVISFLSIHNNYVISEKNIDYLYNNYKGAIDNTLNDVFKHPENYNTYRIISLYKQTFGYGNIEGIKFSQKYKWLNQYIMYLREVIRENDYTKLLNLFKTEKDLVKNYHLHIDLLNIVKACLSNGTVSISNFYDKKYKTLCALLNYDLVDILDKTKDVFNEDTLFKGQEN